jgi:hypothetical protein
MILARYLHRLPADYDISLIRSRAQRLASDWDRVPDLHFKAFLLQEKGQNGAIANSYSSLYVWKRPEALRTFLTGGRFKVVTNSFGRPAIDVRVLLDARRGPARHARIAVIEEAVIPPDADPTDFLVEEEGRNRALVKWPEIVAAVAAVDTVNWRILRAVLAEKPTAALPDGTPYEVLHLAKPTFDELP